MSTRRLFEEMFSIEEIAFEELQPQSNIGPFERQLETPLQVRCSPLSNQTTERACEDSKN
jgi:hypothetical protein